MSTSGIYDAIGNVYEWTVDRTTDVLTGVSSAQSWVRSGGWLDGTDASVSPAYQHVPGFAFNSVGFRCGR